MNKYIFAVSAALNDSQFLETTFLRNVFTSRINVSTVSIRYFLVSLFAAHKSSFCKEACNLKTKSPKECLNFKIANSLLAVSRKYGQKNFELRKKLLEFYSKNHNLNNLDTKTFIYLFIYFMFILYLSF